MLNELKYLFFYLFILIFASSINATELKGQITDFHRFKKIDFAKHITPYNSSLVTRHSSLVNKQFAIRNLQSTIDTMRVLGIRVEFQPDDDPTTTGNGKMNLNADPPHNKAYFESMLNKLAHYYHSVSNGKLVIKGDIYPAKENSSYLLPHNIRYYGGEDNWETRLVTLFYDAIVVADSLDPTLYFKNYDAIIIIWAGSTDASDIYGDRPNDPTAAFISSRDLDYYLGKDRIAVKDTFVYDAVVLPEMAGKEYFPLGDIGTWVHEFGHKLGLPDLYNTETGDARVGIWCLMDFGMWNANGHAPSEPSAWCKMNLGWVNVDTITSDTINYALPPVETSGRIVKVPITTTEYFLLEYRQRDPNKNGSFDKDEYDYYLPGSGLLIWHIDESYLNATIYYNIINNDLQHQAIDLKEADNVEDQYFFGGMLLSNAEDAFFFGNNTAFTPTTLPSSNSLYGANSGIYITNISKPDSVMKFTVKFTRGEQPSFPKKISDNNTTVFPPIVYDFDNDGKTEIIVANRKGDVYLFSGDTTKIKDWKVTLPEPILFSPSVGNSKIVIAKSKGEGTYNIDKNGTITLNVPLNPSTFNLISSPILTNINSDSLYEVIIAKYDSVANKSGLYGINSNDFQLDGRIKSSISIVNKDSDNITDYFSAITDKGYLYLIDVSGNIVWQRTVSNPLSKDKKLEFASVVGDIDNDGNKDIIVSTDELLYAYNLDGALLSNFPVRFNSTGLMDNLPIQQSTYLALGDIDNDGYLEIVFAFGNKVFAYNHNGSSVINFPISIKTVDDPNTVFISASPTIADIDNDGALEIIIGTTDNRLFAFNGDGSIVKGFPYPVGGYITNASAIINRGNLCIAGTSSDGYLHLWNLNTTYNAQNIVWGQFQQNPQHTGEYPTSLMPTVRFNEASLIVANSFYNYPNPAKGNYTFIRYRLNAPAKVNLKIYNVAGDLIAEIKDDGEADDNEVQWDISKIASGIYFCQLSAKGSLKEEIRFHKIAIVR